MEANVTLKRSFIKRRLSRDNEVPAEVKLKNGKEFNFYFVIDKEIIEITSNSHTELLKNERLAIIEEILKEYTLLFKSIFYFTISYCLEDFKFVDSTQKSNDVYTLDVSKQDSILKEYLESNYAKISTNKLFRVLKRFYDSVKTNKSKVVVIPIEYKLNVEQRADLIYYIEKIQRNILKAKRYDLEVNKRDSKIILTRMN